MVNEQERSETWKTIDQLIRQHEELRRRMAENQRELEDVKARIHELSDSESLDEIKRKLTSLSDPDIPTTTERKDAP